MITTICPSAPLKPVLRKKLKQIHEQNITMENMKK